MFCVQIKSEGLWNCSFHRTWARNPFYSTLYAGKKIFGNKKVLAHTYIPCSTSPTPFTYQSFLAETKTQPHLCISVWNGVAELKKVKTRLFETITITHEFPTVTVLLFGKKVKSGQNLFRLCSSRGFRSKNILTGQNSKTHRDASPQFTSKARVVTFPRFSSVKTVPKLTYAVRHSMSAWLKARPEEWSRGQSEYPRGMTRALMIFLDSW